MVSSKKSIKDYVDNNCFCLVMIRSTIPDKTFIGILLLAQDNKSTNVGSWKTSDSSFESISCGGVMHNSNVGKTNIQAVWHPPSNIIGNIIIKYEISYETN